MDTIKNKATRIKERVNYVLHSNGMVSGSLVNIPVGASAENLDILKVKLKKMAQMYIEFLSEIIDQDEPFDTIQVETLP